MKEKNITRIIPALDIIEGEGAQVKRSIGGPYLSHYDPFLLLDEFIVTPPAGFPYHAHRGFEAITYMIKGAFRHEDKTGNSGIITQGDLQLMNTGNGIRHTEIPYTENENHGFQLWINLPRRLKTTDPAYQLVKHEEIPAIKEDGLTIRILLGEYKGHASPGKSHTAGLYFDIIVEPGAVHESAANRTAITIPEDYQAFLYVYEGLASFGSKSQEISAGNLALLGTGDTVLIIARNHARLLLAAGKPHNEPIIQHGPFVD